MKVLVLPLTAMAAILIFHTIIEHSELNEAESLFAAADIACRQQDAQEFISQVTVLSVQLRLLAETQAVSIKNIL